MKSKQLCTWNVGMIAAVALLVVGTPIPIMAQEESQEKTPLEIEAEEAKLRAQIAEDELKAAKSKQDLEELGFADSSFEPERASLSLKDKAGYFGELLSFVTLEAAAKQFVESLEYLPGVDGKPPAVPAGSAIIVTSDYEFSKAGALWHLADGKLGEFEQDFVQPFLALPAPQQMEFLPAGVSLLTSSLGAASELAAFFRVKRELSGREITPSTESLVTLVAKQLKAQGYEPILPQLVVEYETDLAKRIDGIRALQKSAEVRKHQRKQELKTRDDILIDIDKAPQEIADLKKKLKDDPNNAELNARLDKLVYYKRWWDEHSGSLDLATSGFRKFMARLETVPEKATQSPIELLYAYEALVKQSASVLLAQAVSQGADVETSSGALRRTKISFVGGSASLFYLSDVKGKVLAADVIPVAASRSFTGRIQTQDPTRVR